MTPGRVRCLRDLYRRNQSSLRSLASLALLSQSSEGLGHCDKDPGEGKESYIGKHRFVYLYVVKLK